jgi:trimethylamine--corrinoid protein Co-methyltransferase
MLEILSRDEIYAVHLASMEVLEKVGVGFNHEGALKIFEDAGAYVDLQRKIVKIPEYLVREALSKAPSQVILTARNPKHNLRLGRSCSLHEWLWS